MRPLLLNVMCDQCNTSRAHGNHDKCSKARQVAMAELRAREEREPHEEVVATLRESRQVIAMALKTGAPDWFDTDEKVALHVTVQRIDAALAKATQ